VQVVVEDAGTVVLVHCRELSVIGCAVTVIVTGLLVPFKEDVITEVWSEDTAAAVAVKVAEEAAAGTVTEAGTVKTEVTLLDRATLEPPAGAALESVMVQVVVEDVGTVVLAHCRALSVAGASNDRLAVALTLFNVALTVAVWSAVKDPAVALKVALTALAGIETVAGSVRLPVEVNATVVAEATAPLKVTVQTATAPGASDGGVQEIPLRREVTMLLATPPLGMIGSWSPAAEAPRELETPMAAELAFDASVTDAVATMPLAMPVVFMPEARQV
jgi:hypothetical protein